MCNPEFKYLYSISISFIHRCSDGGFLKIYLHGQEERQALDEFDLNLCGTNKTPFVLSDGPRLAMLFSSSTTKGRGFKAKYIFQTGKKNFYFYFSMLEYHNYHFSV